MPTCVEGHVTVNDDYCDVCGSPVATAVAQTIASAPAAKPCPACQAPVAGRFCEACGHDSAASAEVVAQQTVAVKWEAVVAADREYHKRVIARGGPDTVEFPASFPERRILLLDNTLIGRASRRQGVEPGIDLGIHPVDRGVSTQHAVLRLRDGGPTITDVGSTNGTSINDSDELLSNGTETPVADGDRIHVGAWTTITIVKAE